MLESCDVLSVVCLPWYVLEHQAVARDKTSCREILSHLLLLNNSQDTNCSLNFTITLPARFNIVTIIARVSWDLPVAHLSSLVTLHNSLPSSVLVTVSLYNSLPSSVLVTVTLHNSLPSSVLVTLILHNLDQPATSAVQWVQIEPQYPRKGENNFLDKRIDKVEVDPFSHSTSALLSVYLI